MVAPLVASLMVTVCAVVYTAAGGENVGVAAVVVLDPNVQPMIS
jgi:hypothetical protein